MIKAQVIRFLPPDDSIPPESLSERFRNELLSGVIVKKNLRGKPSGSEPFRWFKADSCLIELDRPLVEEEDGPCHVLADVRIILCEFTSADADKFVEFKRLQRGPYGYVYVVLLFNDIGDDTMWRYTAFWQAWSVPVCDDVRRVVFGFL